MRIPAVIFIAISFFLSVGCGPRLQPAVQGEWSNVHNDKDQVSKNNRPSAEKPAAEK